MSSCELWAGVIVDTLVRLNVRYFVCAPGSRNTPLLLAIASHPQARSLVHIDERGCGFHALGYAKATKAAAALVVTSGTAAANLLPAIIEADREEVPLLVLTADRPPELRDCGAAQSCDQVKMFSNYVRWHVDLPCPEPSLLSPYLASTLSHAVLRATTPLPGPVHINCMFREPFFSSDPSPASAYRGLTCHSVGEPHLDPSLIATWAERFHKQPRGVISVGSDCGPLTQDLFAFAERTGWPIVADVLSPARALGEHPLLITHSDLLLKSCPSLRAHALIQLGGRRISKIWTEWIERQPLEFALHISSSCHKRDPSHLVTHHLHTSPSLFLRHILPLLKEGLHTEGDEWERRQALCREALRTFFEQEPTLTEPGLIWQLQSWISAQTALFIGNSMPIRDADQFLPSLLASSSPFGNRGVCGIDGLIATASGVAEGSQRSTLALIGDLSCLHDLNSLALIHKLSSPLILCVINNGGGGIFSFLPVAQKREHFQTFFATPHSFSLSAAAQLFDLPYVHPQGKQEFGNLLEELRAHPRSCVIEVNTHREDNVDLHRRLFHSIAQALSEEEPHTLSRRITPDMESTLIHGAKM